MAPIRKAEHQLKFGFAGTTHLQSTISWNPIPFPEDLMRKLGGGYGFTKIDLADANTRSYWFPKVQNCLALNTNRGVQL